MNFQLPPEQQAIRDKCFHPSRTFVEFPIEDVETSIPARFEKVVRLYPERVALVATNRGLSFEELNRQANRLAWRVLDAVGAANDPVLLACEHGIDAIVGALGILKAGKTLVAVDPSFPLERIRHIADDSHAAALIATAAGESLVAGLTAANRPLIRFTASNLVSRSDDPGLSLAGQSAAQIVYTSGSTGRPKGVLRNHARMIDSASLLINAMHIESHDRLLLLYSLSFGAGLTEILKGLLAGASLFPFDIRAEGLSKLSQVLDDRQITYFSSSPSCFRYFADDLVDAQLFPSVRVVELGSEPLSRREVQFFRAHFGKSAILVNRFASSETATVCLYFLDAATQVDSSIIPVGYPVPGKVVSILDEHGNAAQTGYPGEIAVQSQHLSSGYWNNSTLTREKFARELEPNTAPIYRTGDFGELMADGRLVYLGRKDDQVKIRGFRVQPSEVQAVLLEHHEVRDAAVVTASTQGGETFLIAYVVPRAGSPGSPLAIRQWLRSRLPEQLIPSRFVLLKSLPLTASGKLDRQALPTPAAPAPDAFANSVAPRTPTEKALAAIWAEILGLDWVGVHDNFFDLGGHSLLMARLFARIKKDLNRDIALATLFRAPTVAQFAQLLEGGHTANGSPTLVPIQPGGSCPPLFCVHGVWGSIVFGAELSRRLGADQPFYGLQARGLEGEAPPLTRIEDMAAHHVYEIRRIQPDGPYFLAGLSMGGMVAFEMAQQLHAQGQSVGLLALLDTSGPARSRFARTWTNRTRQFLVEEVFGRLAFHVQNIFQSNPSERTTYVKQKTRRLGRKLAVNLGLDYRATQVHLNDVYAVKVREANFAAMRKYEPRSYPGRITLLTTVNVGEKNHHRESWQKLARGGLEVRHVPGDHSTMINDENIGTLAAVLDACLKAARKEGTSGDRVASRRADLVSDHRTDKTT